ncbi:Aste57867_23254 [Aphanomyces stellatus]|uniref:Aste57867_23254 protein n=1 Tax=Aphanomyces stellatus TaxID=120398 RepID=A0A485LMD9_9STRA|nr:hypothetical protein As57867_023183 [Aphanomyces stellatus]VFT99899.1 Aste57867_23254 [Aphanomyces stellatus]
MLRSAAARASGVLFLVCATVVYGSCDDCEATGDCTQAYRGFAAGKYCGRVGGISCCCPMSAQCANSPFDCKCRNLPYPGYPPSSQRNPNDRTGDIIVAVVFFTILLLFLVTNCVIRCQVQKNRRSDSEDTKAPFVSRSTLRHSPVHSPVHTRHSMDTRDQSSTFPAQAQPPSYGAMNQTPFNGIQTSTDMSLARLPAQAVHPTTYTVDSMLPPIPIHGSGHHSLYTTNPPHHPQQHEAASMTPTTLPPIPINGNGHPSMYSTNPPHLAQMQDATFPVYQTTASSQPYQSTSMYGGGNIPLSQSIAPQRPLAAYDMAPTFQAKTVVPKPVVGPFTNGTLQTSYSLGQTAAQASVPSAPPAPTNNY